MCRKIIGNNILLFPIKQRTPEEFKKDIGDYIERNKDTVYIDEIEDDNDGMPGLVDANDVSFTEYHTESSIYLTGFNFVNFVNFVNLPIVSNSEPMYYNDNLDELLSLPEMPWLDLARLEDLIPISTDELTHIFLNASIPSLTSELVSRSVSVSPYTLQFKNIQIPHIILGCDDIKYNPPDFIYEDLGEYVNTMEELD